jgi:hypothetical protein
VRASLLLVGGRLCGAVGAVLHIVGVAVTAVLLTIIYGVVLCPIGLTLLALKRAPLYSGTQPGTTWRKRDPTAWTPDEAARPY